LSAPAYVNENGTWVFVFGEVPDPVGQYYGETIGDLADRQVGDGETLSLFGAIGTVIGDAVDLREHARGGDDGIHTELRGNKDIGDALVMHDRSVGGADVITASGLGVYVYGDASLMFDRARGGDDMLTLAGFGTFRAAFGDAGEMSGHSRGGDDHIVAEGQAAQNILIGDAASLSDSSRGGDDTLVGGEIFSFQTPGNVNFLYGDGIELSGHARGGDDTLVSGTGTDHMWGDAELMGPDARGGFDTFVFLAGSGNDTIFDFDRKEVLDVSGYGVHELSELQIESPGGNTVVHFDGTESVTLLGVTDLSEHNFLFA
jgi:hypothetical protein